MGSNNEAASNSGLILSSASPEGNLADRRFYRWLQILQIVYFLFVQLSLWSASPGIELDMAEQIWLSDHFSLVYGSQPPLYTWITRLLLELSGGALLPLYLFKAVLLATIAGSLLAIGYRSGFGRLQLTAILAGVMLIPELSWEAQRDLTHTLLATALGALLLLEGVPVAAPLSAARAARAGFWIGAGMLAKYNFAFLAISWLVVRPPGCPGRRPAARLALLALGIAALLFAPHALSAAHHVDLWLDSAEKLELEEHSRWVGLLDAVGSTVILLSPLIVLPLLSGFRPFAAALRMTIRSEPGACFARLFATCLVAVVAALFVMGASHVRERWLLPLFFFTPVLVGNFSARLPAGAVRRFVGVGLAFAVAVAVLMPARIVWADALGSHHRRNLPYRELVAAVRQDVPSAAFFVTDNVMIAAQLRLAYGEVPIYVFGRPNPLPPPSGRGFAVGRGEPQQHDKFALYLAGAGIRVLPDERFATAPLYYSRVKHASLWWAPIEIRDAVEFDRDA